jgi:hypothetical protein
MTASKFPLDAKDHLARRRFLERRSTRDARVPLVAGDDEFLCGWQNIPLRPTDDPAWFIIDSSHDRRTVWARWHEVAGTA